MDEQLPAEVEALRASLGDLMTANLHLRAALISVQRENDQLQKSQAEMAALMGKMTPPAEPN